MPRLFVAIDLPEEVKARLTGFPPELPHASWVAAEQLHLTLRFIGEVDDDTALRIRASLAKIRFAPFPLTLCGIGHFPPGRHPRVLWVGMQQCDPLLRLQQEVELALVDSSIEPEERRFSPHITLARLKTTPPSEVACFETRHESLSCPSFEVRQIVLYSSLLTRHGAIHSVEASYPASMPAAG